MHLNQFILEDGIRRLQYQLTHRDILEKQIEIGPHKDVLIVDK